MSSGPSRTLKENTTLSMMPTTIVRSTSSLGGKPMADKPELEEPWHPFDEYPFVLIYTHDPLRPANLRLAKSFEEAKRFAKGLKGEFPDESVAWKIYGPEGELW